MKLSLASGVVAIHSGSALTPSSPIYLLSDYDFPITASSPQNGGNWIAGRPASSATATELILLTSDAPGTIGLLWNSLPIESDQYEIDLDVTIMGGGDLKENSTTDGFAIWIAENVSPLHLLHPPSPSIWNLLGFNPLLSGLGVVFSTTSRGNLVEKQSVSLITNDGVAAIHALNDVPSRSGIYWPFKQNSGNETVNIWFVVDARKVHGYVKRSTDSEWQQAFVVTLPAERRIPTGYLVLTASNDRPMPSSEIGASRKLIGARMIVDRIRVTTTNQTYAASPRQAAVFKKLKDLHSPEAKSLELIMSEIIPEQQVLRRIVQEDNMARSKHNHKFEQRIMNLIDELKSATPPVPRQMMGVPGLQDFAEMQKVMKNAQTTTFSLIIGLALMTALMSVAIFKRIGDIEKKHYLY